MPTKPPSLALRDLVRNHQLAVNWIERHPDSLSQGAPLGTWTAAEHLLHLALWMEHIADVLDQSPPPAASAHPNRSFHFRWILLTFRFPSKLSCPDFLIPQVMLTAGELVSRFDSGRDRIARSLRAGGHERVLAVPHFGDLSLEDTMRVSLIHSRHHLSNLD
ncbi:MAG: DinB family protein [Planctomycetota bacterium]